MTIVDMLLSAQSLLGFSVFFAIWILSKTIDKILEKLLGKRIVSPIKNGLMWRWRAFLTRFDPISASYKISYTPRADLDASSLKSAVDRCFNTVEKKSGG